MSDDRIRRAWREAQLTDQNGTSSAPRSTHLQTHRVRDWRLVPESVTIESREIDSAHGREAKECICYPFPEGLGSGLDVEYIWNLQHHGWRVVPNNPTSVLKDFLRLTEAPPDRVARFAQDHGPLWICGKHWHERLCVFAPVELGLDAVAPGDIPDCAWHPYEPVTAFRREAHRVKATLDMAADLIRGKPAPRACWKMIGDTRGMSYDGNMSNEEIGVQRWLLQSHINSWLVATGGSLLAVDWGEESTDHEEMLSRTPRLSVLHGFGVLSTVWIQVAQLVTGAKGVFVCSACREAYIRYGKRPPDGERNYCDQCRGMNANRAAWAQGASYKNITCQCGNTWRCRSAKSQIELQQEANSGKRTCPACKE